MVKQKKETAFYDKFTCTSSISGSREQSSKNFVNFNWWHELKKAASGFAFIMKTTFKCVSAKVCV